MSETKKQFDAAIGAAATFISEKSKEAAKLFNEGKDAAKDFLTDKKGKSSEFINDKKDKVNDFLDEKKEIYQTKKALEETQAKVEALFGEIGRISYYGKAIIPKRTRPVVKQELVEALTQLDELQQKYDALYAEEDDDDNCTSFFECDCDED